LKQPTPPPTESCCVKARISPDLLPDFLSEPARGGRVSGIGRVEFTCENKVDTCTSSSFLTTQNGHKKRWKLLYHLILTSFTSGIKAMYMRVLK
jgi:hypothetical protein